MCQMWCTRASACSIERCVRITQSAKAILHRVGSCACRICCACGGETPRSSNRRRCRAGVACTTTTASKKPCRATSISSGTSTKTGAGDKRWFSSSACSVRATAGCTIRFKRRRAVELLNASDASCSRASAPSAVVIACPNSLMSCSHTSVPGTRSVAANWSLLIACAPSDSNMRKTVVLPSATPPVMAIRCISHSRRSSRFLPPNRRFQWMFVAPPAIPCATAAPATRADRRW